ncbi:SH3 domain-containing protein [Pontibaca sp. S1109L]|uniref:SH3 domain-containing protein n=2 Tax=Pontibaca salina TaxID=2795731 RepID=A0A934M2W1_9RHOB|nr:SH3 domain-containing protein [Pontibaca salina]MBI6629219.1 SH3 domain-containing protein [Pontibaca salina]
MSGGSDFRPPEPPTAIAQAEPGENRPTATGNSDGFDARPMITNLRAKPEKRPIQESASRKDAIQTSLESGPVILSDSRADSGDGTGVRVATLEPNDITLAPSGPHKTDFREIDIRLVIGTNVNMRQGPGTSYPVIARMDLGDKVEVLSDPGNGWLRLRNLREMRIGWIAASLIGKER